MAKFSRLLLGGVVGAGLAYLFSRKDVRRRLMGGGQGQLMAPEAPATNIPVTACAPVATPVEAPEAIDVKEPVVAPEPVDESEQEQAPEPAAMDLESTIEETRRQVEEQLEAPPAVVEAAAFEEGIDTGEAPEILLEEEPPTPEASVEEIEEAEAEALTEAVETNGIEAPAEKKAVELEAVISSDFQAAPLPETETEEFASLSTPVAGEPTSADTEAGEAAPVTGAGPAPSQIDRDEMRRRIDETRARLKAKAFDALVSGETFIEPETGDGQKKHETAEVDIDSEIGEQIDRSLREED
ncbi:MAG: hypothetical protein Q7K29_02115 [Thermoleophilia bacterium]|nr:hypothetical protein [Thermoleophilia bacterium]